MGVLEAITDCYGIFNSAGDHNVYYNTIRRQWTSYRLVLAYTGFFLLGVYIKLKVWFDKRHPLLYCAVDAKHEVSCNPSPPRVKDPG